MLIYAKKTFHFIWLSDFCCIYLNTVTFSQCMPFSFRFLCSYGFLVIYNAFDLIFYLLSCCSLMALVVDIAWYINIVYVHVRYLPVHSKCFHSFNVLVSCWTFCCTYNSYFMHAVSADLKLVLFAGLISIIVYCVSIHTSSALISNKLFWRHI